MIPFYSINMNRRIYQCKTGQRAQEEYTYIAAIAFALISRCRSWHQTVGGFMFVVSMPNTNATENRRKKSTISIISKYFWMNKSHPSINEFEGECVSQYHKLCIIGCFQCVAHPVAYYDTVAFSLPSKCCLLFRLQHFCCCVYTRFERLLFDL